MEEVKWYTSASRAQYFYIRSRLFAFPVPVYLTNAKSNWGPIADGVYYTDYYYDNTRGDFIYYTNYQGQLQPFPEGTSMFGIAYHQWIPVPAEIKQLFGRDMLMVDKTGQFGESFYWDFETRNHGADAIGVNRTIWKVFCNAATS